MAEDLGKFQIGAEIDSSGIDSGMNASISSLTSATGTMTSIMQNMQSSIQTSSSGAGDAVKSSTDQISSAAEETATKTEASTSRISSAFTSLKAAVGAVSIGIAAYLGSATKSALDHEKAMMGLSRVTGMSIQDASQWSFAAKMSGVQTESFSTAVMSLSRGMLMAEKSMDTGRDKFTEFGVSVKDTNGHLLPTGQILSNIAERYNSLAPGMARSQFAFAMFRGEAQAMIPFLQKGAAGIDDLRKKAEQYGAVVHDTSAYMTWIQAQRQMSAVMDGFKMEIGNAMLPALTRLSTLVKNLAMAFNQISPETRNVIIQMAALGGAVGILLGGMAALKMVLVAVGFERFAGIVGTCINPVGLLTGAVGGLISGLTSATMAAVSFATSGTVVSTATGVMTGAVNGAKAAMLGMRLTLAEVSMLYRAGGVTSVLSYMRSLISMNGIVRIARVGLMALYGTVIAGIAVVVALAGAWTMNFGSIQEATAGTCDGIIYGLNNFSEGVSQMAKGIGEIFVALAKTIGNAIMGDFSGAIDSAKGLMSGLITGYTGLWQSAKGLGQAVYGAASDPEGAMKFGSAAFGAVKNGVSKLMTPDAYDGSGTGAPEGGYFEPDLSPDKEKKEKKEPKEKKEKDTDDSLSKGYQKAKDKYEEDEKTAQDNAEINGTKRTIQEKIALYQEDLKAAIETSKDGHDYNMGYLQLDITARKQAADEKRKIDKQASESYISMLKDQFEADDQHYADLAQNGLISQEQLLEAKKASLIKQQALQKTELEAEAAAAGTTYLAMEQAYTAFSNAKTATLRKAIAESVVLDATDKEAAIKAWTDITAHITKSEKDILAIDKQVTDERLKNVTKVVDSVSSSFGKMTTDLVTHAKGWKDALISFKTSITSVLNGMVSDWVSSNVKKYINSKLYQTKELKDKQTMNAEEKALNNANASSASTSAASASTDVISSLGSIMSELMIVYSIWSLIFGGSDSSSSTTYSPASSYRQTGAVYSSLPSYDVGTLDVAKDQVAQIHQGEAILPKPFAEGARSFIANGGFNQTNSNSNSNSNSNVTKISVSPNYNMSAIDGKGLGKVLSDSSKDLNQSVYRTQRSNNLQNQSRWGRP